MWAYTRVGGVIQRCGSGRKEWASEAQGGLRQSGKAPRSCGPEHYLWFVQQGPEYQVSLLSWKKEAMGVLVASEAWVCGKWGVVHAVGGQEDAGLLKAKEAQPG